MACRLPADQVAGRLLAPWPISRNGPLCVLQAVTVLRRRSAEGADGPVMAPAGGADHEGAGRRHHRHRRHRLIEMTAGCGGLVGQADQIDMGWFTRTTEDAMKGTLTEAERIMLSKLEATVESGVQASLAVIDAGKALAQIRDRQLFRDVAATWEDYVEARFRMTRRRADQLIAFAGVKAALEETGTRVPEMSEKAARPLVGLSADTITEIVTEAAGSPEGVTASSIKKAAAKRKKSKAPKVAKPQRFKVAGAIVQVVFNRKGTGSAIDALTAALRQAEADLERQAEAA